MTTMKTEDLTSLGFNRNEAKVYVSLIKFGKADANQIIKDTKFHKNIVYDNLEKLIDKGLVTFIIDKNKKLFQIASPEMLISFFEEQEKEVENRKKLAVKLSEEIKKTIKKIPFKSEATIYKGIKGIKAFFNEVLREGKDFVVFGAPKESIEIMDEHFWKNFELKRNEMKIKVRMIFNPSLKDFGKKLESKFTLIRYFDKDFEPLTETHIEDDKVAIIVWSEEPILFLIKDKFVANSYFGFFEKMWEQARK